VIHFNGTITKATGGLLHLAIAGPAHFLFDKSYTQSFDQALDLAKGSYTISLSAATEGSFTFDVTGDYESIDPHVPDSFNNAMHMYDLIV